MAALPEILETLILEGRALFREKITEDDPEAFTFYQMSEYIYSQTILNNIFFGKTKTANPQAQEIINQSIIQLLIEEDLLETIIEIGMHYQVGTKGDKLSGGQQQKLAIARIFLKAPVNFNNGRSDFGAGQQIPDAYPEPAGNPLEEKKHGGFRCTPAGYDQKL